MKTVKSAFFSFEAQGVSQNNTTLCHESNRMIASPIALRFAELAMKVWHGDRSVFSDLKRIVPRPEELEESQEGIVGRGPGGIAVGLPYGLDPVNALVQIGFLYAGMMWPFLSFFHEANKAVRKMWREELKRGKAKHD